MAERLALEFTDPAGDPVRFEWSAEALAGLDPAATGAAPAWRLGGELDWDEVETVRILSARLDEEGSLAVVALRPGGAAGHGDEVIAGAIGGAEGFDQLDRVLLSAEYGAEAEPLRIGLELYRDPDAIAIRIAGNVTATAEAADGGLRRCSAALELRGSAGPGVGVLDVLTRE